MKSLIDQLADVIYFVLGGLELVLVNLYPLQLTIIQEPQQICQLLIIF